MSNRLQHAASPYLLQHADNPVDWYPWGTEAFQRAERENKPVLVSIGYAACHWCHVMAGQSFENEATAAYMNQHFINVKVDREEHPDVDHLYMDALQLMTGSGGWPLNMFVTPDKKPFYGGTYFPPEPMYGRLSWRQILEAIHKMWQEQPDDIALQSDQLVRHLQQAAKVVPEQPAANPPLSAATIDDITRGLMKEADRDKGGFGRAPKFPATMAIRYLLQYAGLQTTGNAGATSLATDALAHAQHSLDKMIDGGIYDQIGGGFARYATDDSWRVPHFEKMLYDNALMIIVLADAVRLTGSQKYKTTLDETVSFCRRALRDVHLHEGFWCALDADSEGMEGKFYTWDAQELQQLTPPIHPAVLRYYGITEKGDTDGKNILYRAASDATIMADFSLTKTEWEELLATSRRRLYAIRQQRTAPAADDKVVLSWNALMNIALVHAGIVLERPDYIREAQSHLDWLLEVFKRSDGGLAHVFKNGKAYIPAKLDDYALLIKALLNYASVTGASEYINKALPLLGDVQKYFACETQPWFYFSSSLQTDIVVRKVELYDGALPSANAIMAENLACLGNLMERTDWLDQSGMMIRYMQQTTTRYPLSFSYWAALLLQQQARPRQLIIAGDLSSGKKLLYDWHRHYFAPQVYAALSQSLQPEIPAFKNKPENGVPVLYLCETFQCAAPVGTLTEINAEIKKMP